MDEKRIAELERRLARQEDRQAIQNLMGRYQYLMTGGQNDVIARELYVWDIPGNHCEYGPLGVYEGQNAVDFFLQVNENFCRGRADGTADGTLELHQLTTPVIEVAGDGMTAKGMWMSTGVIMTQPAEAPAGGGDKTDFGSFHWDTGKYAVDFIKTDSGWKIWHLHVLDLWNTGFDEDPVKNAGTADPWTTPEVIDDYRARAAAGENVRPMGFPIPDGPTTFHYSYCADRPAPREPLPPVPYETFSETFSY